MGKHKSPVFSRSRSSLFIFTAGVLGIVLVQVAISLNTSYTTHAFVVRVFWGLDCQPMPCSLDFRPEQWLSPFLIIGIGLAYGFIQSQLFRRFFHLNLPRWTLWTTIGTALGFLLLFTWNTIYNNWIFPIIQNIPLISLFFDYISPWFTFWLIFLSLPIGLVQAFRLHQRFKYAWVWAIIHPIGSLIYGLIAHLSSYEITPQVYMIAFVLGALLAVCFIWIMRHPHIPTVQMKNRVE